MLPNEIRLIKAGPLRIKIDTEDVNYIRLMKRNFTAHVANYFFMPLYRSGRWNGEVCMITNGNIMPYGLIFDFMKYHKDQFPRNILTMDDDVKFMFRGKPLKDIDTSSLSLKPYDYQKECIETLLRYSKGIIRSATASGKSLIIAYTIKNLMNIGIKKSIIVVPRLSLVEQFYTDLIEYGFKEQILGKVSKDYKEWDKPIVISTWQTLSNNHNKISNYDCIVIDEVHQAKARELKKILAKATKANYRFGFSGTMHPDKLDNWNVKSYLGPVLKDFPSGELAERGYIAKCNIKVISIDYFNREQYDDMSYNDIKDNVFTNIFRMNFISHLIQNLDHNVLVLVGKVEKEGEPLSEHIKELAVKKDVVFISGRDNVDIREEWRQKFKTSKNIVLVGTYGVFQEGINIPNLKYVMLAAPFKSKVRILQSIGRSLRKHAVKEKGAIVFDIHDRIKFFEKYGDVRYRYYNSEGFDIKDYDISETTTSYDDIKTILA